MDFDTFSRLTETALITLIVFTVLFLIRAFFQAHKDYKEAVKRETSPRATRASGPQPHL